MGQRELECQTSAMNCSSRQHAMCVFLCVWYDVVHRCVIPECVFVQVSRAFCGDFQLDDIVERDCDTPTCTASD